MKQFVVFALEHKHTGNRWVDVAYDIKHKLRQLRKIVNERVKADRFSNIFWSEVYDFNDLIVVILFTTTEKDEAKHYLRSYKRAHKPAYNINPLARLRYP